MIETLLRKMNIEGTAVVNKPHNIAKGNYTDDNIFILCTEVIIEHVLISFIQNMVVFYEKIKSNWIFPTIR